MRVLKKVNNVESSWRISFVVSHPIREQVLLSLYWPNQVDKCSAAVVQYWREGERNRGKKFPHQPPSYNTVTFLFFHVIITSSSDGKIKSLQNLKDETIPPSTTGRNAAMELPRAVLMKPECALVYTLYKCALTCVIWFAEKRRWIWIRFEHVLIWFGEKQAGEGNVKVSTRKHNSTRV